MSADIVTLLLQDHEDAQKQLEGLANSGRTERSKLFRRLAESLVRHEVAEESVLYPVVCLEPRGTAIADARLGEQSEVFNLRAEMDLMDPLSHTFAEAFETLTAVVSEHAEAEEEFVLPLLLEQDRNGLLEQLGQLYLEVKGSVPRGNGKTKELADKLRESAPDLRRRRLTPKVIIATDSDARPGG